MSDQPEQEVQGWGDYNPSAAHYGPYNDAMAAWRNEVTRMVGPENPTQGAQPVEEPAQTAEDPEPQEDSSEASQEPQDAAEEGQAQDESQEVYDPSEHNAPDVLEYLKQADAAEVERVLESEEAGKNRRGILNFKEDLLAKARERNQTDDGSSDE